MHLLAERLPHATTQDEETGLHVHCASATQVVLDPYEHISTQAEPVHSQPSWFSHVTLL